LQLVSRPGAGTHLVAAIAGLKPSTLILKAAGGAGWVVITKDTRPSGQVVSG